MIDALYEEVVNNKKLNKQLEKILNYYGYNTEEIEKGSKKYNKKKREMFEHLMRGKTELNLDMVKEILSKEPSKKKPTQISFMLERANRIAYNI